jgi:hypothetical protein
MSYFAGTPLDLERYLVKEIAVWVQDFRLKSPADNGAIPVPITVVQGFVPSYYAGPEAGNQDKAPCISIRCTSAIYLRERGKAICNIMILTWDNDPSRLGYQDPLNLATHIRFHLQERVGVAHSFVLADDPIHITEVVDPFKDFFPYFIVGMEAQFYVPSATPPPPFFPRPIPGILEGGTEGWYEPGSTEVQPINARRIESKSSKP